VGQRPLLLLLLLLARQQPLPAAPAAVGVLLEPSQSPAGIAAAAPHVHCQLLLLHRHQQQQLVRVLRPVLPLLPAQLLDGLGYRAVAQQRVLPLGSQHGPQRQHGAAAAAAAADHPAAGSRLPVLLLQQLLPWLPAGMLLGSTAGRQVPGGQSEASGGWVLVAPRQPGLLLLLQSCCWGHYLLLHRSLQQLLRW
jgi:hypothetical protein